MPVTGVSVDFSLSQIPTEGGNGTTQHYCSNVLTFDFLVRIIAMSRHDYLKSLNGMRSMI